MVMESRQFKNLTGVFLNNTRTFVILNLIIFVSLPALIIFRERTLHFPYYLLVLYFCILYVVSKYQNQLIVGKNIHENGRIRFVLNYIILPLAAPIIMKILVGFFMVVLPIDSNPQGLTDYSLDQLLRSIISNLFSGAEEVWRFAAILVITKIMHLICKQRFSKLSLSIGLLVSSLMFGWLHTFPYGGGWFNTDITVALSLMGLMYGLLLIATRNLWSVVIAHIIGNMYTSISLYDSDMGALVQYMVVGITMIFLLYISAKPNSKNKESNQTKSQ